MTDMIDLQRALVADHIADLEREGSAIRAERDRDHLREHAAAVTDPADLPPRRVRLGRWLVAVGQTIAGSTRTRPTNTMMQATTAGHDEPCGDGPDRLARAA